jgi:hypothetical protein
MVICGQGITVIRRGFTVIPSRERVLVRAQRPVLPSSTLPRDQLRAREVGKRALHRRLAQFRLLGDTGDRRVALAGVVVRGVRERHQHRFA